METYSDVGNAAPRWLGFHHVALLTPDLDVTRAFYGDVLGMQVGEVMPARGEQGRHCFIRPGETEAWGLHFFEQGEAQIFQYPEEMGRSSWIPGALQHVAFALSGAGEADALWERLSRSGVLAMKIENPAARGLLFRDNNGILLEATWDPQAG